MRLVDLSHTVSDGLITYPGLPAPTISEHLTFEASHAVYDGYAAASNAVAAAASACKSGNERAASAGRSRTESRAPARPRV